MVEQLGRITPEQRRITGTVQRKKPSQSTSSVYVENVSEKRYLWTARAFAIVFAISVCCNLLMLFAIFKVIPLYRIEPFLLTFSNKSDQVYKIVPLDKNLASHKPITEIFVRQYVLLRSTFVTDIAEMEARWMPSGPIHEMSSPKVYDSFLKGTAYKGLNLIRERYMSRQVNILSVSEPAEGLWQVEYETIDIYPDSAKPTVQRWTANLRIAYRKKVVKYKERLNNPIGFTVTDYVLRINQTE